MNTSPDYSKPNAARNHHEVLRCYDVLVQHHSDKLVRGLIVRMGSVEEHIRLAALTIFKHLITSSFPYVEDGMPEIFQAIHGKLSVDVTPRVQGLLAQLTALLGHKGFLQGKEGRDFVDFVVQLCSQEDRNSTVSGQESTVEMCSNILQLLAKSVPSVEALLWPHLLDHLMLPDQVRAVAPIIKSLNEIAQRRKDGSRDGHGGTQVDFGQLERAGDPQAVLARLIVLAAVPAPRHRGWHILAFLTSFAPNVSRHLSSLWKQRIPLLQHYLDTHVSTATASPPVLVASPWDQGQWEKWLLELLDDTVKEISLEEWNSSFASALEQQLAFYPDDAEVKEKCFLVKCLGVLMKNSSNRNLVLVHLSVVDRVACTTTSHHETYSTACAEAFGLAAVTHLDLVLGKLESLLRERFSKKSISFFGLLRDSKLEEEQLQAQKFVLACAGWSAFLTSKENLSKSADSITLKFIVPVLKGANQGLRKCALEALSFLAVALQPTKLELAQHGDLVHEATGCLRQESWPLSDKRVVLNTLLDVIRCPPFLTQMARCSLLKACFTAVFPAVVAQYYSKDECFTLLSHRELQLKEIVDKLSAIVEELLRQDMQQSTLDEIFTLLEPWMKRDYSLGRDMAISVLQNCLETFLTGLRFEFGCPTDFAPGPYIIGAVIPRCFDSSRSVQARALKCLHKLLRIVAAFEGIQDEGGGGEEEYKRLTTLSVISPTGDDQPVPAAEVSGVVIGLLSKKIQRRHLLPLMTGLIESMVEKIPTSARGTSVVLSSLLQTRGRELLEHVVELEEKLLRKLMVLDGCGETRVRGLTSMRTLASLAHREVCHSLLALPVHSPLLGQEEAVASTWRVMTQEKDLSIRYRTKVTKVFLTTLLLKSNFCDFFSPPRVLHCLTEVIDNSDLIVESFTPKGVRCDRLASHPAVAAASALDCMLRMREMEAACGESDFAAVFVPLISAACAWARVEESEPAEPPRWLKEAGAEAETKAGEDGEPLLLLPLDESAAVTGDDQLLLGPLGSARSALSAYLECKGCPSVARSVEAAFGTTWPGAGAGDLGHVCRAARRVYQAVIQDGPQFLSGLSSQLQPRLSHGLFGRRLASVAFYAEVLDSDLGGVEATLKQRALSNLLFAMRREKDEEDNQRRMNEEESEANDRFLTEDEREQVMFYQHKC